MNRPKDCVKVKSEIGIRVSVPHGFPSWILYQTEGEFSRTINMNKRGIEEWNI
jgi:hypothetical protein